VSTPLGGTKISSEDGEDDDEEVLLVSSASSVEADDEELSECTDDMTGHVSKNAGITELQDGRQTLSGNDFRSTFCMFLNV